ncbi:amino acid transporter [Trypanosoma cruzi]|nr:amino acid transporter [Trypanosoma cruzi]RNC42433.1 amino acid transporter [Trypanosoma cruzi]
MAGLRLVSAKITMHWEEPTVAGTWRTSVQLNYQISMFKSSCPSSGGGSGVGVQQGLIIAEMQILGSDCTRAIAGVHDRSAQPYSQVEEAHTYLSACESHIAVVGGLFAGRGDAVPTGSVHLSERAAR